MFKLENADRLIDDDDQSSEIVDNMKTIGMLIKLTKYINIFTPKNQRTIYNKKNSIISMFSALIINIIFFM